MPNGAGVWFDLSLLFMSSAVSETRAARSTNRVLALPEKARQRPRLALAMVMGFAAVVILTGLGRSSLFIDEIFSWNASSHGLHGVAQAVHKSEVTPPLYYVILHLWITLTGAESEAALRLPSALAGIAFVGAVMWLGILVADRRAAVVAGILAALSPLTLLYAQEVRAYIFVMLAVTVAAAAVVKLSQQPDRRRWLALAVTASAVAVLLHYTAVLVLFPLSLWILRESQVGLKARLAIGAAGLIPFVALIPLMLVQMGAGHHSVAADAYAKITPVGLLRLAGTPFDGRALDGMTASYELGFVALVDAVALLAFADRFRSLRTRWLLVGACVLPVVAIIAVSALAHPLALTRYTAVAVPFMLVAIGVVVVSMPRAIGGGLLALAVIGGALGVGAAQTPSGQWPDTRSAVRAAAAHYRPGDVVVGLNNMAYEDAMSYYDLREMPPSAPRATGYFSTYDAMRAATTRRALAHGGRVWVLSSPPVLPQDLQNALREHRAQVRSERQFGGSYPVQLDLVAPRR